MGTVWMVYRRSPFRVYTAYTYFWLVKICTGLVGIFVYTLYTMHVVSVVYDVCIHKKSWVFLLVFDFCTSCENSTGIFFGSVYTKLYTNVYECIRIFINKINDLGPAYIKRIRIHKFFRFNRAREAKSVLIKLLYDV